MIDIKVVFLARPSSLGAEGLVMVGYVERVSHRLASPERDLVVARITAAANVVARARTLVRKRLEL